MEIQVSPEEVFAQETLNEAGARQLNLVEVIQKMKLLLTLDVAREIEGLQKQLDDLRSLQMRLNKV